MSQGDFGGMVPSRKSTAGEPEEVQERLSGATSQSPAASQSRRSTLRPCEKRMSSRQRDPGCSATREPHSSSSRGVVLQGEDRLEGGAPAPTGRAPQGRQNQPDACEAAWERLWDLLLCGESSEKNQERV